MNVDKISAAFQDSRGEIIDVLKKAPIDYVTIIRTRKNAVRGNHYHKETSQYLYVLQGKIRVVSQMPDGPVHDVVLVAGDLILNVPLERHALESLEDSVCLVMTRGPRGGEDYEKDTYRLEKPLIAVRS
jgi:mannose-6-phosphate isomerase-like protein (cupin superfamily)